MQTLERRHGKREEERFEGRQQQRIRMRESHPNINEEKRGLRPLQQMRKRNRIRRQKWQRNTILKTEDKNKR